MKSSKKPFTIRLFELLAPRDAAATRYEYGSELTLLIIAPFPGNGMPV